jgi:hypothetical protein
MSTNIKTLLVNTSVAPFVYGSTSKDLATSEYVISFSAPSSDFTYIIYPDTDGVTERYYTIDNLYSELTSNSINLWFVDLDLGRSFKVISCTRDTSSTPPTFSFTLKDLNRFEEFNKSITEDLVPPGGFVRGLLYTLDPVTNQPAINFKAFDSALPSNFSARLQTKYQLITPISLSKSTHNIFTGKEVSTGPSYSQHNLGVFSVPTTMSGDFHILVDSVYVPKNITNPTLFKLSIREVNTSNYIIQEKSFASSDLNSLIKEASKTLGANKQYEFFLKDFAVGLVFNLSIYFVQT